MRTILVGPRFFTLAAEEKNQPLFSFCYPPVTFILFIQCHL